MADRSAGMLDLLRVATLRANPAYELVERQHLTTAELRLMGALDASGDRYGVLRPRAGAALESRSASPDTALLFLTLRAPSRLPEYVQAQLGGDTARIIARLILDGVLQLKHDGQFVSGAEASSVLFGGREDGGRGRLGELSVAAVRYAQALPLPEPALTDRLYAYGRTPVSPRLLRRLPDAAAVAAHLGLDPGGAVLASVRRRWAEAPTHGAGHRHWRTWHARGARPGGSGRAYRVHKLYLSPTLDGLPTAVEAVAGSPAVARGASAWKVGVDLHGLCRPDKLVVYFEALDDLQQAAHELAGRLAGCPAHGVPFTAAVTADGLMSWGTDPVMADQPGGGAVSWRMLVSQRLAHYLVLARAGDPGATEPWQFALDRLRLSGIDPDTWRYTGADWVEGAGSG